MKIAVYMDAFDRVQIITAMNGMTVEELAEKDVPEGVPFLYMDSSQLPAPEFRDAWRLDLSKPDGVGLGGDKWMERRSREISEFHAQRVAQAVKEDQERSTPPAVKTSARRSRS